MNGDYILNLQFIFIILRSRNEIFKRYICCYSLFYLVYQAFYGYWYMSTYSKIDAYAESKIYELIDNERRYREKYAYSQGKTEHEVELLMKYLEPSYQREIEKMKDSAYVDWDIDSVLV